METELAALEKMKYLSGPYDQSGAIVTIHSGQGGTEAMDWAEMVKRMYQRYFERKGWRYKFSKEEAEQVLLRTHTTVLSAQALAQLKKEELPAKFFAVGKVFRNEATDASHEHTFYQLEGLMIDKDISIAHLISTMKTMLKGIFKQEVAVRLRPGYFPFVEPGFEVDVSCVICQGKGCTVCKKSGWVEMIGSGLVHPSVLRAGGLNPEKYSGFAFGMGLTRLAMMKYGIDDIRLFLSGDLRFLNQF